MKGVLYRVICHRKDKGIRGFAYKNRSYAKTVCFALQMSGVECKLEVIPFLPEIVTED